MQYAYLAASVMAISVWLVLYAWRQDLRAMMVGMSICALPLALFDLLFVPSYWQPITLFHLPIGIEGFLFSFSIGGIASVLYAETTKHGLRHIKAWHIATKHSIWIPLVACGTFVLVWLLGAPNPEIAADLAIAIGTILVIYRRPDLTRSIVSGSLAFGLIYFASLKVWTLLFPDAISWFTFQGLPRFFVLGVPGWEVIFGFLFGAFWSNLYEAMRGYEFIPLKKNATRSVRSTKYSQRKPST